MKKAITVLTTRGKIITFIFDNDSPFVEMIHKVDHPYKVWGTGMRIMPEAPQEPTQFVRYWFKAGYNSDDNLYEVI